MLSLESSQSCVQDLKTRHHGETEMRTSLLKSDLIPDLSCRGSQIKLPCGAAELNVLPARLSQ
jgi:hypothetical protein